MRHTFLLATSQATSQTTNSKKQTATPAFMNAGFNGNKKKNRKTAIPHKENSRAHT